MTLSCWHDGEKVVVEISDRGGGFAPRLRDVNHCTGDRGFGVHLMHELTDGVEFFDGGRRVRLHKQFREDDYIFRNNVRRQTKRRAFRDFARGVTLMRFVQSAFRRQGSLSLKRQ